MSHTCFKSFCLSSILLLFTALGLAQQWSAIPMPAGRNDDVFFVNDTLGYTITNLGYIYKTTDAGFTWQEGAFLNEYLRKIEFLSPEIGFVGSLDSSLFRTINGGKTWQEITENIPGVVSGVCGLSQFGSTLYGCGKWSGPALFIKSSEHGESFTHQRLDSLSSGLVEVLFISEEIGFLAGKGPIGNENAIILKTNNGGNSWRKVYESKNSAEYVWKLQAVSHSHLVASIQGSPVASEVIMLQSYNSGENWLETQVTDSFHFIQMVGFLDSLEGYLGGHQSLFRTTNGGLTWNTFQIDSGLNYNRFTKVNDQLAFISGEYLYRYGYPLQRDTKTFVKSIEHSLYVTENELIIDPAQNTEALLYLLTIDGKIVLKACSNLAKNKCFRNRYKIFAEAFMWLFYKPKKGGKHLNSSSRKRVSYLCNLHLYSCI